MIQTFKITAGGLSLNELLRLGQRTYAKYKKSTEFHICTELYEQGFVPIEGEFTVMVYLDNESKADIDNASAGLLKPFLDSAQRVGLIVSDDKITCREIRVRYGKQTGHHIVKVIS